MRTVSTQKKRTTSFVVFLVTAALAITYSCTPDALLIDTSLKMPPVPLNTTGWVVSDYSSQEDRNGEGANNGRVFNTFDRKLDTFWHTCWNGCTAVPPNYFIIDMLKPQEVNGIILTQRQSLSRNIEKFSVAISSDNVTWTSLGEFTLERVRAAQVRPFDKTLSARYIRFNVVKVFDGSNNAALAEFAPYF
jgi:hypothetical protein